MAYHRDPNKLEAFVNNTLTHMANVFRDTVLEYWLLDHQGQVKTFFAVFVVGIAGWLAVLEYESRAVKKAASKEAVRFTQDSDPKWPVLPSLPPSPQSSISSDESESHRQDHNVNSFMSKLAPPGHRPTNATLNGDRSLVLPLPEYGSTGMAPHEPGVLNQIVRERMPERVGGSEPEVLGRKIVARWEKRAGENEGKAMLL